MKIDFDPAKDARNIANYAKHCRKRFEPMPVKSKSGRVLQVPSEEETQIRAGIATDPDAYELSAEQLQRLRPVGRPKGEATKLPVSIRLSPEVVAYFKATGKGWQTRVDEVLKNYVKSVQR